MKQAQKNYFFLKCPKKVVALSLPQANYSFFQTEPFLIKLFCKASLEAGELVPQTTLNKFTNEEEEWTFWEKLQISYKVRGRGIIK